MIVIGDPRLPARFWEHVRLDDVTGCWIWTGPRRGVGYGGFRISRGSPAYVHRVAYEALVAPVPRGLQIDHLCRVRLCCNPIHMEPVTQRINLLRGETVVAANAVKTHCPRGHEYTEANTKMAGNSRQCRVCHAAFEARRRARIREAMT